MNFICVPIFIFPLKREIYFPKGFNSVKNLNGYTVLEVGSGRGGGLNYVSTYLGAKQCLGVDFSENQVLSKIANHD